MLLALFLWMFVPIIIMALIHHYYPRVGHVLYWIFTLCFIATVIFGVFLFLDVKEFQERMADEPNRFLLMDKMDDQIIAGLDMASLGDTDIKFLDTQQLIALYDAYRKGNETRLIGKNFKTFIFKKAAFNNVGVVTFNDETYSAEYIRSLFDEGDPLRKIIIDTRKDVDLNQYPEQVEAIKQGIHSQLGISTATEFKGFLFAMLLSDAITEEGPLFVIEQYKKGNIIIREETITFKFISFIPDDLYEAVAEKANLYKPGIA